jgi:hypothetical protein
LADRKNFPLRLDPEVYEALRVWADDELRSVNAQIEFLLVRALRKEGRMPRRNAAQTSPPLTQDGSDE